MTAALLLVAALVLVAFGGFMAASEAALGVTSRADLAELGASGRNARALQRIADDPSAHITAVVFIRVLAETTAAVLVAAAFMLLFDNIWLALLAAAVLMTGISFARGGSSARHRSAAGWGLHHPRHAHPAGAARARSRRRR